MNDTVSIEEGSNPCGVINPVLCIISGADISGIQLAFQGDHCLGDGPASGCGTGGQDDEEPEEAQDCPFNKLNPGSSMLITRFSLQETEEPIGGNFITYH